MIRKLLKWAVSTYFIGALLISTTTFASEVDYGAKGAETKDDYTLEEMLTYAIEDEHLARAEYEVIMEEFGIQKPFSNIIKAEERHIDMLLPLFDEYNITIPEDTSAGHVIVPESVTSALETGVQAEIDNINMYESFLEQDLEVDVREIFEYLKDASENHLKAFERGVSRNDRNRLGRQNVSNINRRNQ